MRLNSSSVQEVIGTRLAPLQSLLEARSSLPSPSGCFASPRHKVSLSGTGVLGTRRIPSHDNTTPSLLLPRLPWYTHPRHTAGRVARRWRHEASPVGKSRLHHIAQPISHVVSIAHIARFPRTLENKSSRIRIIVTLLVTVWARVSRRRDVVRLREFLQPATHGFVPVELVIEGGVGVAGSDDGHPLMGTCVGFEGFGSTHCG